MLLQRSYHSFHFAVVYPLTGSENRIGLRTNFGRETIEAFHSLGPFSRQLGIVVIVLPFQLLECLSRV